MSAGSVHGDVAAVGIAGSAKVVYCERLVFAVYEFDRLTNRAEWNHRKNTAEDLLLHQIRVSLWLQNNCGLDMSLFHVHFSSVDNFATASLDHFLDAFGVELVYDHSLVGRKCIFIGEKFFELLLTRLNELLDFALMHQRVVRRNADLARVYGFSPQALGYSRIDVCVRVHNKWALTAQLQNARD